jgi:hypothetical protein
MVKIKHLLVTGWDNGLSQDYSRGLARWFITRLDSKYILDKWYAEQIQDSSRESTRENLPRKENTILVEN